MPNAITMLKGDHATVKRLLRELSQTTERAVKERERPVSEIERASAAGSISSSATEACPMGAARLLHA